MHMLLLSGGGVGGKWCQSNDFSAESPCACLPTMGISPLQQIPTAKLQVLPECKEFKCNGYIMATLSGSRGETYQDPNSCNQQSAIFFFFNSTPLCQRKKKDKEISKPGLV